MPVDRAKKSLSDLASFGLLRVQTGEETSYSITHRGFEFLDAYWRVAGFLKFLDEPERRLAAIMFTDMVGYTAISQRDEALSLEILGRHRTILRSSLSRHNGKEIKTMGDSFLVEFASALDAANCAVEIQQTFHESNMELPLANRVALRIGVHLGDVTHSGDDVFGDAVNVASRIEPLADPGGICISDQVYSQIKNKFEHPIIRLGRKQLKNVQDPMDVYMIMVPVRKL